MQIYRFNSILKPVLWGGNKLVTFKGLPASDVPIGESWELSALPGRESVVADGPDKGLTLSELVRRYGPELVGNDVFRRFGDQFPLLIKLIDAKRDLSIQVHPGDEQALREHGCKGKNEMWYIIDTDEGATITTGFKQALTPAEFDRHLTEGTILDVVNRTPSKPGDAFYIPAGQIHAIGAGNLLVEVQQSCDITYRVWDYNRRDADGNLRDLHTAQAREALNFDTSNGHVEVKPPGIAGISELLHTRDFSVNYLKTDDRLKLECTLPHSFLTLTCIQGQTRLDAEGLQSVTVKQGETILIPAIVRWVEFTGRSQLLITDIPGEQ